MNLATINKKLSDATAALAKAEMDLKLEIAGAAADAAGIVDPTPTSDYVNKDYMNEDFEYFIEKFGPPAAQQTASAENISDYQGKLPNALLQIWKEVGWASFNSGLFWIVNPSEYSSTISEWLSEIKDVDTREYHAIARTAFGKLFLWGEKTGQTITINPLFSQVTITNHDPDIKTEADLIASIFFSSLDIDYLDIEDVNDKPLFKRAQKKLGTLSANEMYGFEPALCLGGLPKIENMRKLDTVAHLALLAQFGEIEINKFK